MTSRPASKPPWSNVVIQLTIIIVATAILFIIFQSTGTMADPDSFYHTKMAVLMNETGVVYDFPWAQYTVLAENYANQHFLYHILLTPFVSAFDPLIGVKVATVMLAGLLFVIFYLVLRSFNVRWPLLFTLLLLTINPLTFRLSLAKANGISLMLLLIGLALAAHYRWRWLAVVAFLYVWFYGGFALLFIAVTTYVAVSWLVNRYQIRQSSHRFLAKVYSFIGPGFTQRKRRRLNLRIWLSVLFGLIGGIIINPYWPKNLALYFDQLINIGIINFRDVISVGGEWYAYAPKDLVANTVVASVLLVITLVLFAINFKKQSKISWTTALLWLFFLILTLKSRRYVEYYVPFAMLFSAVSLTDSLRAWPGARLMKLIKRFWRSGIGAKALAVVLVIFIVVGLPYVVGRDIATELKDHQKGFSLDLYQSSSQWLLENSEPGSIVFHDDWDEFPILFYHNSHNYYIVGLDPTFMYLYDEEKYWQWVHITTGQFTGDVSATIRQSFAAEYVFVATDHTAMDTLIKNQTNFPLVYEDDEARIYKVTKEI